MAALEPLSMAEFGAALDDAEHPKKLAILGLPWDTTEETLRVYFSQFGELEHAEVMKDRYTGKSRGFGFVTYVDSASATAALGAEHAIDGRRCEAKVALPKGEPGVPRTTRIFIARIPPSVTEVQFRGYFEAFGKLQDAYMPKDHAKQGYRGIGFVTYTSADSVEKIMAVKHWMNGHGIAIDRATPKDDSTALKSMFTRMPLAQGERRSFDNGSGIIGPGLTSAQRMNTSNILGNLMSGSGMDVSYSQLRGISEEGDLNGVVDSSGLDSAIELGNNSSYGLHTGDQSGMAAARLAMGMGLQNGNHASQAAAAAATLQSHQACIAENSLLNYNGLHTMAAPGSVLHNMNQAELQANLLSSALSKSMHAGLGGGQGFTPEMGAAAMQQLFVAAAVQNGRRSLDSRSDQLKRNPENPAIANARAGPRIFIGKLTKETSEADVKDYFMRFGYVMDVYMPKSKDNKSEHRGFGFVTFETDAAIQRVVSHGAHRLKGSTIAIDIAMPKQAEEEGLKDGMDGSGAFSSQLGMASLGIMPHNI